MESVDAVTRQNEPAEDAGTPALEARAEPKPKVKTLEEARIDNPWAPLLSVGLQLLETLAAAPMRKTTGNGIGHEKSDQPGG